MEKHEIIENDNYKEAHGSGFISTMIFMTIAIVTMIAIRYFLNY